jgi:hypothetical protein
VTEIQSIDAFLDFASNYDELLRFTTLSYLAVKAPNGFAVIKGRLQFRGVSTPFKLGHFTSAKIRAGQYLFSEFGISTREFLEQAVRGTLQFPDKSLRLVPASHTDRVRFTELHPEGIQNWSRMVTLEIECQVPLESSIRQPQTDWDLLAGEQPYDGVAELAGEFGIGALDGRFGLEAVVPPVIEALIKGTVSATTATIGVIAPIELDPKPIRLGYRIISNGVVTDRGKVNGEALDLQTTGIIREGTTKLEVPPAAVVHCVARYREHAVHQAWISDPDHSQNPRRTIYQNYDPQLEVIGEYFRRGPRRGNARDLESAVAWLLWMGGFSILQLGDNPRTQDAPDLIAMTPSGNVAVIECTTGLLKSGDKLPALVARTAALRKRLEQNYGQTIKVISIMVTTRSREEVTAELEQAERHSVLVVTKEDLENAQGRTILRPEAEKTFSEAVSAIAESWAKHSRPDQEQLN